MKNLKIIFILFILILIICNISFAESNMQIISDKMVIEQGEETDISINIENIEIAALTLELYWDNSKLEYISGPENSNDINNKIIYVWISQNGENTNNLNIETFKFKAIQDGITSIACIGECYNSNGDKVEIGSGSLEIKIEKENEQTEEINVQNENVSSDNTDLSILRLNHEGISPNFNKDIKEYYFVTDDSIQNLEITAIPQNKDANVTITGNNNLKIGENTIEIKVESQDKTETSLYKIYVTKTTNLEIANANLETLAVRQASLEPEFNSNITNYKLQLANDINKIDVLAIPQRENSKVNIIGNEQMQIGDNKIEINVVAENGTTHKTYEILVHRRNNEEETTMQEEVKIQAERLSAILEEEQQNKDDTIIEQQKNIKKPIIVIIVGICSIVAVIFLYKLKIFSKK